MDFLYVTEKAVIIIAITSDNSTQKAYKPPAHSSVYNSLNLLRRPVSKIADTQAAICNAFGSPTDSGRPIGGRDIYNEQHTGENFCILCVKRFRQDG